MIDSPLVVDLGVRTLVGMVAVTMADVLDASGATMAQTEAPAAGTVVQQTLTVKDARLGSVDDPNLYTLVSEVLVRDGAGLDAMRHAKKSGFYNLFANEQVFDISGLPVENPLRMVAGSWQSCESIISHSCRYA